MSTPRAEQIARSGRGTTSRQDNGGVATWEDVQEALRSGEGTSWLSIRRSDGGVHTRPLFAAWDGRSFIVTTNAAAAKTRHLTHDPDVSVAVHLDSLHLVAEGRAARLLGRTDLERASQAMLDVFDWPTTVVGDELDAPYAAPTSGGPPFQAWEITPRRIYAFPTEDQIEPTRFLFD